MVEFISFVIFIILFALSIYQIFKLRVSISKMAAQLVQAQSDNTVLATKLGETLASQAINENEGFVKFLSTSRDWAFEYIEEVQDKILNLKDSMENGNNEDIDKAYRELVDMLPKENS